MLNIEWAMKLTKADELLEAVKEAEHSNCEPEIIRELYRRYLEAVE